MGDRALRHVSACIAAAVTLAIGVAGWGNTSAAAAAAAPPAKAGGVGLPAAPGREVVERVCSGCHSVALIGGRRDTPKGWQRTVDQMIGLGASPTAAETDQIVTYLSANLARK
jgi:cytochrome c5